MNLDNRYRAAIFEFIDCYHWYYDYDLKIDDIFTVIDYEY